MASQVIALAVHHRSRSASTYTDTFFTGIAPKNYSQILLAQTSPHAGAYGSGDEDEYGGAYKIPAMLFTVVSHLITANAAGIPIQARCGRLADRSWDCLVPCVSVCGLLTRC
ncbi:uncharacterized protein BBA_07579 [Beauveria bassiana ARSEF 2860]|uniref:Uncharacterized protein n=1 Tax=Beauveria bassiana (strain ARSEF 2860) TaxID=655819 RepID=J5JBA3_BEAB2|nr:uncharacterized protein BBA_07579 [Beauveria bassiana ARSEF 2860]EJP63403.1 hypothetical protein BBA_07579 [Beauveria bassiana ARSEF 2860]